MVSIEDPFDQDDWPAWAQFTASVGIQVKYHKILYVFVQDILTFSASMDQAPKR